MAIDRRPVIEPTAITRAVARHQQVAIAGRDVGVAGHDQVAVLRFLDLERGTTVHTFGERPAERLRDVLSDDDAGRIRRQHLNISRIASVPPVEAPIAIMRSVVLKCFCAWSRDSTASAFNFSGTEVRAARACSRAPAAIFTLPMISSA